MTVVRGQELGQALAKSLAQINQQIEAISKVAEELGCTPYEVRDSTGAFMMTPMLAAKAQVLHALVLVNQRRN